MLRELRGNLAWKIPQLGYTDEMIDERNLSGTGSHTTSVIYHFRREFELRPLYRILPMQTLFFLPAVLQ